MLLCLAEKLCAQYLIIIAFWSQRCVELINGCEGERLLDNRALFDRPMERSSCCKSHDSTASVKEYDWKYGKEGKVM